MALWMHSKKHPHDKARYRADAKKRMRPDTGKPWRRGEMREDGMRFACYLKDRDADAEGYFKEYWVDEEGWAKYQAKLRRANQKRYKIGRALILEAKSSGCVDCGYNEHPAALDLDHRPGVDKKFELALGHNRSAAAIKAELAKCDVVCANCHRIRTFKRSGLINAEA